jgi:hypothetical protein
MGDQCAIFLMNFAEMSVENSPENSPAFVATDSPLASPVVQPTYSSKPLLSALTDRISDLLGADGKLKPEECQRRLDNGLCLYCSKSGHLVADCPGNASPTLVADSVSSPDASESESE